MRLSKVCWVWESTVTKILLQQSHIDISQWLALSQSALTGESLPVTKKPGDEVYSGSTCKQGELSAVVIATGVHSFFGKAAHLVDSTHQVGHFQKVSKEVKHRSFSQIFSKNFDLFLATTIRILLASLSNYQVLIPCWRMQVLTSIGNFCIVSIATGLIIEIIVMYAVQKRKYREGIDNLLVLLIGGIPIAMPTVLSVTMAIGSHRLSQQVRLSEKRPGAVHCCNSVAS